MPEPDDQKPAYELPRERRPASAEGTVDQLAPKHDPYGAFRSVNFRFYESGNFISIVGRQMLTIAVEWEVYARTNSATALGLVGLAIALPLVLLSLPGRRFR